MLCYDKTIKSKEVFILKKIICCLILAAVLMSLAACSGTASDTDSKANETTVENTFTPDPLVEQAIDSVKKEWIKQYDKNSISDRYLEIKNTRVITIKDNESEYFKDIDKIVEFVLFSNYFDSAPYYFNATICATYILYKDGRGEVNERDYFNSVRQRTFNSDFSDVIEKIDDCGGNYNAVYHL